MIVTGGISPNAEGGAGSKLSNSDEVAQHCLITEAVHAADASVKICMQILHAGPLANPTPVAPSSIKSRIARETPRELDEAGIEKQLSDFANCARLAIEAGYDGVEIIASAGYLLSAFLVEKTNRRCDRWGGSFENRMRFPVEVMRRVREAVGNDRIVIYRVPAMDMLEGGMSWEEVVTLTKRVEEEGASIINCHFTWHEAAIPTIATMVPRAAFTSVTERLRKVIGLPIIASNRINMPDVAEDVLARGAADLVAMARPMLADAEFVNKAAADRTVYLMQRRTSAFGRSLGRTTGWTHRITLKRRGVRMMRGVEYRKIDDQGLHVIFENEPRILDVDTVIICAGQEPRRALHDDLAKYGISASLIGGAYEAAELDAKTAIDQATRMAAAV